MTNGRVAIRQHWVDAYCLELAESGGGLEPRAPIPGDHGICLSWSPGTGRVDDGSFHVRDQGVGEGPLCIYLARVVEEHLFATEGVDNQAFVGIGEVGRVGIAVLHIRFFELEFVARDFGDEFEHDTFARLNPINQDIGSLPSWEFAEPASLAIFEDDGDFGRCLLKHFPAAHIDGDTCELRTRE